MSRSQRSVAWVGAAAALALWGWLAVPEAIAGTRVFVSNQGDDTVSVVDRDLAREIAVIPVGRGPMGLALHAEPPLLAVAASEGSSLTLIDPVGLEALPDVVKVGRGPEDVAFDAAGKLLFATSYHDRTMTVSDVATREPAGPPLSFDKTPRRLRITPDGKLLLALLHDQAGELVLIGLPAREIVARVPVGQFPTDLGLTPDASRALVASYDGNTVTAVDLATRSPAATYDLDTGLGLVVHPRLPLLYSLLDFDGEVVVYDYARQAKLATVGVGSGSVRGAITRDGAALYVVNTEASNVVEVDTTTNRAVTRIAVGSQPADAEVFEQSGIASALAGRQALLAGAGIALLLVGTAGLALRRRRRPAPA